MPLMLPLLLPRLAPLALAALLSLSAPALAGPQFVDPTGYAVSGYDVVSYHALPQAAIGAPQPAPLPGRATITAEWNDATFAFATEANRAAFLADPARYAPAYDGYCAYGVAGGYKVQANPLLWRIVDGRLFLNYDAGVVRSWEADIPGQIARAETNWPGIAEDGGPWRTAIPGFVSTAPLAE